MKHIMLHDCFALVTMYIKANPMTAMSTIHKFCMTQATTSFALLRIQLPINHIENTRQSLSGFHAQLTKEPPKAFSLFLIHSFGPFSPLGGAPEPVPPFPEGAMLQPTHFKVASLPNTLAIVSLKLVIWFISLPLRRLMLAVWFSGHHSARQCTSKFLLIACWCSLGYYGFQ